MVACWRSPIPREAPIDRQLVYLGQVPRSLDTLLTGQNTMTAVGQLAQAVLGTATIVAGFTVSPTNPTSLSVILSAGQIYQQENLEASAISGLAVDTHTIIKQGINLDPLTLTLVPPTTIGFAQNVLIEAQYADSDAGLTLLSYQNPADRTQTFQGSGGNGQKQATVRKGIVAIQLKAGVAATSGTQTTPLPDAGWVGLSVVTVAYGQTSVTGTNIAPYANAPYLPVTLPGVPAGVQAGSWTFGIDNGVANALNVVLNPSNTIAAKGQQVLVQAANTNSGAATIVVNGAAAVQIVSRGLPLVGGEIKAGQFSYLTFDGQYYQLVGASQAPPSQYQTAYYILNGTFTYTVPPNVSKLKVSSWGAGGSGGGVSGPSASGAGGGGGGHAQGIYAVTGGATYTLIVGKGAVRSTPGPNNGAAGGTTSFGSLISATGGSGGAGVSSGYGVGKTPGGVGIGGTLNVPGGIGRSGFASGGTYFGGDGGSSWCSGEIPFVNGGYHDGEMPGQGGAGAGGASGPLGGGAGSDGACFVECVG